MSQPSRVAQSREAARRPVIDPSRGRLEIDVSGLPKDLEPTWIRETTLGERDDDNVSAAMDRGYRPVDPAELPNYRSHQLPGARGNTDQAAPLIRRGGQILMVREKRIADEERAFYAAETDEALKSVARDTAAPKDGKNFRDMDPQVSSQIERGKGRFSE